MNVLAVTLTVNVLLAILLVFAIAYGIYWLSGRFGSPTGQKITGIVCLVLWVLYSLNRLGLLSTGSIQL